MVNSAKVENTTSNLGGRDITDEIEVDEEDVVIFSIEELAPSSVPITIPYVEIYRTNELEYIPYLSPYNVGVSSSNSDSGDTGSVSNGDADSTIKQIISEINQFSYSHSCSDGECIKSSKQGDCWALSDYIASRLNSSGISAKIYQYATSGSSRHRQVKYQDGSNWVMFPYSESSIDHNFYTNSIPSDAKEI